MVRDPATRGTAVILFGIAVMAFGQIAGSSGLTGAFAIAGMLIAIVGLIDALTESRKG